MLLDVAWIAIALLTGMIGAARGYDFVTWFAIGVIAGIAGLVAAGLVRSARDRLDPDEPWATIEPLSLVAAARAWRQVRAQ